MKYPYTQNQPVHLILTWLPGVYRLAIYLGDINYEISIHTESACTPNLNMAPWGIQVSYISQRISTKRYPYTQNQPVHLISTWLHGEYRLPFIKNVSSSTSHKKLLTSVDLSLHSSVCPPCVLQILPCTFIDEPILIKKISKCYIMKRQIQL